MVDESLKSHPKDKAISYISELKRGITNALIVQVGKTNEFYDCADQSYQLPKESG